MDDRRVVALIVRGNGIWIDESARRAQNRYCEVRRRVCHDAHTNEYYQQIEPDRLCHQSQRWPSTSEPLHAYKVSDPTILFQRPDLAQEEADDDEQDWADSIAQTELGHLGQ